MRRLLVILIILFFFFLVIQFSFKFFGKGHDIVYQIQSNDYVFEVHEVYTLNYKDEINNYYFKIKTNDSMFSFQTFEDFNRSDIVIKDIKYFNNNKYECILPIFRGERVIFDVMCKQDNLIYNYHNLKGEDQELDTFVANINEKNYKISRWVDNRFDEIYNPPVTIYQNNILDNHFVGVNNYKGLYTINNINLNKIVNIELFGQDIYERELSAMVGKFYLTANYESENGFSKFYIVDLTNNFVEAATTTHSISFNSYIMGIVKDSLYIFDRDNKVQYEIDADTNKILQVGNVNTDIKFFNNGKWEKISVNEAVNDEKKFINDNITTTNGKYERIDKIGNVLSGYYYYYEKDNKLYNAYRANVQNPNIKTYLFSTNKLENINYIEDYVYFTVNNEVKYYHDKTGVRTLFKNEEFEFNDSLFYNVYLK